MINHSSRSKIRLHVFFFLFRFPLPLPPRSYNCNSLCTDGRVNCSYPFQFGSMNGPPRFIRSTIVSIIIIRRELLPSNKRSSIVSQRRNRLLFDIQSTRVACDMRHVAVVFIRVFLVHPLVLVLPPTPFLFALRCSD